MSIPIPDIPFIMDASILPSFLLLVELNTERVYHNEGLLIFAFAGVVSDTVTDVQLETVLGANDGRPEWST
jgi:hypothetical protein